jgi:hypothetical protein
MNRTIRDLIDEKVEIEYVAIPNGDGGVILRTKNLDVSLDTDEFSDAKALLLLEIAEKAAVLHDNEIPEEITGIVLVEAMDGRVPPNVVTECVRDIYATIKPIEES